MTSRIAGISGMVRKDAESSLEDMLVASGSRDVGVSRTINRNSTLLGGWSWGSPTLADKPGILVALDGQIYNRDELAGDDTTIIADLYRKHGFAGALERLNGD